ncbi:MAG: hypothetical protein RLZZ293_413 [Pseudomonadota bacterium]|jgi:anthranilate synthase component 2
MILLIDNYDSFTYNLYQSLAMAGAKVLIVRNDKITIQAIEKLTNLTGIVLSPGPGHPNQAGICIEVIRQLGTKLPILGVCLGHQAIGVAFGGVVDLAPEVCHGKASIVNHQQSKLFYQVANNCAVARYHSLVICQENFPQELQIDASTNDGIIMAVSHRQLPIYGVQFHPESILTPDGQQIINNFVGICNAK